ncbi:hypothetical protein AB0N50_36815, partial [Streptomyces pharetrae]|uniref:hypothetical protein n=1 Tax=Streptomyces pharetrae TaxID=291370 RepID=UPI0034604665
MQSQMLPGDTCEQLMPEDVPVDHDHHGLDHPTLARSPLNRYHAPARKSAEERRKRRRKIWAFAVGLFHFALSLAVGI